MMRQDEKVSERVIRIRNEMVRLRNEVDDIARSTSWTDRVIHVSGSLSCAIVALHDAITDMEKAGS